LFEEA
jgi:hypothetical protein